MSLYDIHPPPLWPHFNNLNPYFIEDGHCAEQYVFSPPFFAADDSLDVSSSMQQCLESILSDEYMDPHLVDFSEDDFKIDLDEFEHDFGDVIMDHDRALDTSNAPMDVTTMQISSSVPPMESMEIENELCLLHLLVAYAESVDNQETLLSKVIVERMIKKVNPVGGIVERVLYYMFRHLDEESDCLIQESLTNFYEAFKAFYLIFPYRKFAHYLANSSITEAMPSDVDIIHIIDFDIGEGIQISSLLEEIIKHYQCKEVGVTSVRFNEDGEYFMHSIWNFEDTKIRIRDQARFCGVNMKIESASLSDLENKLKNIEKESCGRKSWYVFNCMALPHMGRTRGKNSVFEFLKLAKSFLQKATNSDTSFDKGIITYGDGDVCYNNMTNCGGYTTFLDSNFTRFRAFLESMEFSFPYHLGEARTALECLFVAPHFSSIGLERKWEENKQYGGDHDQEVELGMEGLRLSEKCLLEAFEMVKEGDENNLYGVRFTSEKRNEVVMDWRGIPLVRVCCWKR